MAKKNYNPTEVNGQQRVRRSFVVYTDTMNKFSQIAKLTGVTASELLQQVILQTVDAWEKVHGAVTFATPDSVSDIDVLSAVQAALAAPRPKRGNPHPTGRKPKKNNLTSNIKNKQNGNNNKPKRVDNPHDRRR